MGEIAGPIMTEPSNVQWRQVNAEPFEYAIQQGPHGDEFVKLLDGTCLRRSPATGDMRAALEFYAKAENWKQMYIASRGFSVSETLCDGGERARAALASTGNRDEATSPTTEGE